MADTLSFDAKDKRVHDVMFANYKFRVPRYQRPYAWGEDEISEFWTDLIGNEETYFIGSLILNNEPYEKTGYIDIIDGQQRLLTITIFLASLRDIANSLDEDTAKRYQRQDIAFEDRDGKEYFRILTGDSTKKFFEKNIQSRNNKILEVEQKSLTKEELRIKKNYDYLHKKVINELNKFDSKKNKLSYLNSLREKVSNLIVIHIQIQNEEEAYEIFETTNARGVDLSVSDLLKNFIFKKIKATKDRDRAKIVWQDITKNIQETDSELKKFIRYFWLSKHAFIGEKKLFKAIKQRVKDWELLLDDLYSTSVWYNNLFEGSESDFQDLKNGHKIYKAVSSIRLMNVSQCYVLFLSILRNFEKLGTDPTKIFELIERFTFQYSVVCKLPGNKVERIYSKYALKIEEAVSYTNKKTRLKKVQRVFSELRKQIKEEKPSLEVFIESFQNISYKNSEITRKLIRYILGKINDHKAKTKEQKPDFNNVNIEHILPLKPDKTWKLTRKDIKGYVNKLGNLTLLSKKINSEAQNKHIKDKIKYLERSQLPITKILVKELKKQKNKWSEKEILERQEILAEIAYNEVWNY